MAEGRDGEQGSNDENDTSDTVSNILQATKSHITSLSPLPNMTTLNPPILISTLNSAI